MLEKYTQNSFGSRMIALCCLTFHSAFALGKEGSLRCALLRSGFLKMINLHVVDHGQLPCVCATLNSHSWNDLKSTNSQLTSPQTHFACQSSSKCEGNVQFICFHRTSPVRLLTAFHNFTFYCSSFLTWLEYHAATEHIAVVTGSGVCGGLYRGEEWKSKCGSLRC